MAERMFPFILDSDGATFKSHVALLVLFCVCLDCVLSSNAPNPLIFDDSPWIRQSGSDFFSMWRPR